MDSAVDYIAFWTLQTTGPGTVRRPGRRYFPVAAADPPPDRQSPSIDHFAAEARHYVKQVIDDFCVRTLLANFEVHGRVHVHGDGFDTLAALLSQQLEEWSDRFPAIAFPNPQHPHSRGIQSDSGIPVSLMQGEFVHDQALYAFCREVTMQVLQALVINVLDGMPMQAG